MQYYNSQVKYYNVENLFPKYIHISYRNVLVNMRKNKNIIEKTSSEQLPMTQFVTFVETLMYSSKSKKISSRKLNSNNHVKKWKSINPLE